MIGNTTSSPFGNRQRPALSAIMLVLVGCLAVLSACGGEDTAPRSRAATVLAFTPTTGGIGTIVTVTGTNFSTTQSVTIAGAPAIVLSQSGSALTALVMPGAVTGPVQVTRASGVLTSPGIFTVTTTGVPATQQGPKLVGTGAAAGIVQQGYSVALSADGATALVGGPADDTQTGAAWVFTRTGGSWTQQGTKLVGTGAVGAAWQGHSVALSADGATALVGGPADDTQTGAAWVFTRTGGSWTQQGTKLVGTGAVGAAQQGWSVALSADGATALVGGPADDTQTGAAWVFTRTGGSWTQQGAKLIGIGAVGAAWQGWSVALSADGATALVGGPADDTQTGAAWVFTRTGGSWTQQGAKLIGIGAVGAAWQGWSVALSADGATALVGGPADDTQTGAAWVFTRTGGSWTQQGAKLIGIGAVGAAWQGWSVALSADGATALVGGPADDTQTGAAWVFTRTGGSWTQQGAKLIGIGAVGAAWQGWSVALSADGATALVGGPADDAGLGAFWVFAP